MRTKPQGVRGFTLISLLAIAVIIVFTSVIAINLVPPYLNHFAVQDALKDLAKNPEVTHLSRAKLNDLLSRKLQVNYIKGIAPEALVLDKKEGKTFLTLKYEIRVHLIGNIDALVMFDDEAVVGESS